MSKADKKTDRKAGLLDNIKQQSDAHEIADLRVGKIDEKSGKMIELIDVDSLIEAPKDWDRFPETSKEEFLRLKFSVVQLGLIHPIVVWDRGREGKIILAGKNRTRLYKELRDSGEGNSSIDYNKIPATVYERREIDEDKAKDIIIDSNVEQRKDNTKDLPFVVQHKVNRILKRKNKNGDTMDQVAKEMNLSRTKIYEEKILATEIHDDIASLYYNKVINRKTVLRFHKIDLSAQGKVYDKILKGMTKEQAKAKNLSERTKELKKGMNFEEIKHVLTKDPDDMKVHVTLKVPQEIESKFMKMAEKWLEENS